MNPIFDPKQQHHYAWKGKAPGVVDFQSLLDLLNYPAIVIDSRSDSILAVNPEFHRLSGYSIPDLQNCDLSTLFPNTSRYSFTPQGGTTGFLRRFTGEILEVTITCNLLDASTSRVLLLIEPSELIRAREISRKDIQSPEVVRLLLDPLTANTLKEALEAFLSVTDDILPARIKCIYQIDYQQKLSVKLACREGPSPFFPSEISEETNESTEIDTWQPGKRVSDEFSRIARAAELPYLIHVPLVMAGTRLGHFVLSDTSSLNLPSVENRAALLAKYLEVIFYHFAIRDTLQITFQQHMKELSFRDTVIQRANEGIILLKRDLSIEEVNPAAEFIFGYASRELSGEPIETIIIGTDELLPALNNAREGLPTVHLGETHLHRRNGESFLAVMQTFPVFMDDELQGVILLIRDESQHEQIRLNSQHMEQQAILGRLTAVMAHEVRNPINNISTGLQMLSRALPQEDTNRTYIDMMFEDLGRLTHLMESVLQFSKFNEYRIAPSDLAGLFHRIFDRYRPRFTNANIHAILEIDPNARQVLCDLRAMESVFTNIINNAITAMPKGGALAVKMVNSNEATSIPEVEITISDTGPGIPEELREHIFEPFVSHSQGGTGLGLALTKSIVSAHKGSITVDSFPGGTVFHVTLPAEKNPGGK